uniref:Putative LOV domain-containing protein n=1 Tax=Davallia solida var. fejeensis TaxID=328198 RepID=A0A126X094_DAVSF|nr:putative LOV domain-containing protein [Davallia solida var. fejeensis]
MGLEAPSCNPPNACTTSTLVLAEEKHTEEEEEEAAAAAGGGRKSSSKAHVLSVTETEEDAEEEHGLKNSIKAKSYTASGSSRGDLVMASFKAAYKDTLREALQRAEFNFVLTDPRLQDNPIVYASDGFLEMTGYTAEEVLGRNCRFLQGPATSRQTILEIRDAIREEKPCQVSILNYTKQKKPFWNLFHMAPVYSKEDGRVVHFVGVQTPIISSSDRDRPPALECFCAPASPNASSPTSLHAHVSGAELHTHRAPIDVDEDSCEVKEGDKDKAKSSVNCVLSELVSKGKGMGVTETRCTTVAAGPGGQKVICSSLMLSLTKVQQSFVLANPHLPDSPIVHASEMFLRLTGYSREEVIGRNCRFLQGPDTDRRAVQLIGESLRAEKSCTVKLLNYRKDKKPFWNLLHISPVRSSDGKVAFFVGVQLEVSSVEEQCLGSERSPHIKQLGAVGAVRVAVRSLQGEGLRRVHKS